MELKFAKKVDLKCSHYSHNKNATMSGEGYINYFDRGVDFNVQYICTFQYTMYMCIKSSHCTPFKNHIVLPTHIQFLFSNNTSIELKEKERQQ